MSQSPTSRSGARRKRGWSLLYERGAALIALANFGLVLFDLSYVPWRDFWLQGRIELYWLRAFGVNQTITLSVPILSTQSDTSPVTRLYDPVKAIQPNATTQNYLDRVDELQQVMRAEGLNSQAARQILFDLRVQSNRILDTDPFRSVNKSGRLVQIENRMLALIPNPFNSAQESFERFWTVDYLTAAPEGAGLDFFGSQIRPLLEINYARPISETGEYVDYFPLLDAGFVAFFFLEFLLRTYFISRRHVSVTWRDAMLWRWSDVFLFVPFWRFLRVIPVFTRLGDARLFDIGRVQSQVSRGIVATVGEDLAEVVVIQVLNQLQVSVQRGDLRRVLPRPGQNKTYIDLNNVNEVEAISNILIQILAYRVIPTIQPDLKALLRYNLDSMLKQVPALQRLEGMPGFADWSTQVSERLADELVGSLYTGLIGSLEDPVGRELSGRVAQNFSQSFMSELGQRRALEEIRDLLVDLLEEVKINYIERTTQEDVEDLLEQTRRLRQQAQSQDRNS